ncbi:MAG TPA: hypothetical protein DDW17_09965 [Deltaproteobacteria bacterium]|nr:hypothetical protein [Deltaproteobacteria bacterium]
MNIADIEDILISTIEGLNEDGVNLFTYVGSLGRKGQPSPLTYPCALVYFVGDDNTRSKPRPVYTLNFEIVIMCRNLSLKPEEQAARDSYVLLEAVEQAINGKRLGIDDIEPWTCMSRDFVDYDNGLITYSIKIQTRHYLNVPVPD